MLMDTRLCDQMARFIIIIVLCTVQNVLSNRYNGTTRIEEVTCSSSFSNVHRNSVKENPCALRDTFVDISHLKISGFKLPFMVKIKQCSGSQCFYPNGCYPMSYRTVQVPIVSSEPFTGIRKCNFVTLEEHASCGCRCQRMKEDCNDLQMYDPNTCSCICLNEETCTDAMEWDEDECRCVCNKLTQCTTNKYFIPELCKCATMMSAKQEDDDNYFLNDV